MFFQQNHTFIYAKLAENVAHQIKKDYKKIPGLNYTTEWKESHFARMLLLIEKRYTYLNRNQESSMSVLSSVNVVSKV